MIEEAAKRCDRCFGPAKNKMCLTCTIKTLEDRLEEAERKIRALENTTENVRRWLR